MDKVKINANIISEESNFYLPKPYSFTQSLLLPPITSLEYFAEILHVETCNFITTHHLFSPKAVLLNFDRNETEPVFSADFGRRESRKIGKVFQSTFNVHLVM